jgi:hypothetical protein
MMRIVAPAMFVDGRSPSFAPATADERAELSAAAQQKTRLLIELA